MGAEALLSEIRDTLAALEYAAGAKLFATVQGWDADAPDAQLTELQETDGRFALVLHEQTQWQVEQRGRVQASRLRCELGVLISNAEWAGQSPPTGAPGALATAERVAESLAGKRFEAAEETLHVTTVERFRPEPESGRAAARICYRVGVVAVLRAPVLRSLTR